MGARDQEAGRIGSIHYRISHSAGVTLNSNPPSFLERKIFIHYTIPAECRLKFYVASSLYSWHSCGRWVTDKKDPVKKNRQLSQGAQYIEPLSILPVEDILKEGHIII
jgi:hypothetical protein